MSEKVYHLKHRDDLLQQLAEGMKYNLYGDTKIGLVAVDISDKCCTYRFSLTDALDMLANDIYWDERGNWSEAHLLDVTTF